MRIAVIGANGQLGSDVVSAATAAGHEVASLTHEQLEIAGVDSVATALENAAADLVVNTAAMHNVETCESDPALAFAVNAIGARNVAKATAALGTTLVHVSTDYVFGGEKREPYSETDLPAPVNVYGNSKLAGELFVRAENARHFVVRTSAIYGVARCRAKASDNFVRLMLRLGREKGQVRVVADEMVSPTWTADVARQILALAPTDRFGLYHAVSRGEVSWYDYAAAIFELAGADVDLHVASATDFPAKVRRPAYSVLDNAALRSAGLEVMPPWRDALVRYLETIGELKTHEPVFMERADS